MVSTYPSSQIANGRSRPFTDAQVAIEWHWTELDSYRRMLLLLGEKGKAVAEYREARKRLDPNMEEWERRYFDYACGDISESHLLSGTDLHWFRFHMHYQIAVQRLAAGDRTGARDHFGMADEHTIFGGYLWELVHTWVMRMKEDPNWPPWFPVKE